MSSKTLNIVGAIMVVIGGVWIFQGTGHLGGSFMTGQPRWTWIGGVTATVGVAVLLWASFRRT